MVKTRAWPVKAMYLLIAAALAISLVIIAAPAHKMSAATDEVVAEWDSVTTPSEEDWLLSPRSYIVDYAVAEDGDVAYAIVKKWDGGSDYYLLKSEDGAATWDDDINDALVDELEDDFGTTFDYDLLKVATDAEDSDFVAVALDVRGIATVHVYISDDGGETFEDTGALMAFTDPAGVFDLAVSPAVDDERDMAIGGTDSATTPTTALIYRSTVTGDSASTWEDATYDGWDNVWALMGEDPTLGDEITSLAVVDIHFPLSWPDDGTILVATADNTSVYLQSGTWGEVLEGWNQEAEFAPAVAVENENIPLVQLGAATAGITTPENYSADPDDRYVWVNVNYLDGSGNAVGLIYKVIDDIAKPIREDSQISGNPWLTNVSYWGNIASGKAIAGVLGSGTADGQGYPIDADCCKGVQVYRNDGIDYMDICCIDWTDSCKPPTGRGALEAFYVSDDKAYAVTLGAVEAYDESAWSVNLFDDGDVWNQLSLIDTHIDFLSDVAVSPDCNKMMLVSVNLDHGSCYCDSVWLYANEDLHEAPEYTGHWVRTWCGNLLGFDLHEFFDAILPNGNGEPGPTFERGLLRLAPEEDEGDTVYLVDVGTDNIYVNGMETWGCWDERTAGVDQIVDLAVKDKSTIYALDFKGDVAMSDDYGLSRSWGDEVDSEVDPAWTIAVWGDNVLVGGCDGEVSHSDDGGETFTAMDKDVPSDGDVNFVTVAFDTYFDQNDTFYAAVAGFGEHEEDDCMTTGGVYRWIIDDSDTWKDLGADSWNAYTGLVLDRPGNPYTSPDTGGVLYASYISLCEYENGDDEVELRSGVARYLEPAEDVVCQGCGDWDYLVEGLTYYSDDEGDPDLDLVEQLFIVMPDALKICGCLAPDTNSKLFAIGIDVPALMEYGDGYDMEEGEFGTVWTFEDCYGKKAPEISSPEDGDLIDADPCVCYNRPFTVSWDRLCDACVYQIEFALDEEFTSIVEDASDYNIRPSDGAAPSYYVPGELVCEFTYYYRVRAIEAENGQVIRSWWSVPLSVTIEPSADAAKIDLVSPVPGAQDVPPKNLGFSWSLQATADSFDWVLNKNGVEVESAVGLPDTYYQCTKTLEYGATYNWEVKAYNEGSLISTSAVGTFNTAAQGPFCCPQDGMCFDTQAELEAYNAENYPPQPATPFWVWVVIGIGAVLVIVVIVLIFRTRRV